MRRFRKLKRLLFVLCPLSFVLSLTSCEGTTFRSSVPMYPVRVEINLKTDFTDLTPENFGTYITVNEEGYKKNGTFVKLPSVMDAWGYGGVVVYISLNGYDAYDLACPNCALHGKQTSCAIDGFYAVCPDCGEKYDLASGTAAPQKGLVRETLRRLRIMPSGDKLTITQQQ